MVRPELSFQERFGHFSYKRANVIWSDSTLFFLRRIWAKKKSSNFSFDQNKSFDQRTIKFDPYCLL